MYQTVSMIVSRSVKCPDTVQWRVRRVWSQPGQVTRDKVVAQGVFTMATDPEDPLRAVRAALAEALIQLDPEA